MRNISTKSIAAHPQVDPFPDEDDWYTREREIHPLQGGPEPKRRFTPSKWEEKK